MQGGGGYSGIYTGLRAEGKAGCGEPWGSGATGEVAGLLNNNDRKTSLTIIVAGAFCVLGRDY